MAAVLLGTFIALILYPFEVDQAAFLRTGYYFNNDLDSFHRIWEGMIKTKDLGSVYSQPWNQSGPIQLFFAYLLVAISNMFGSIQIASLAYLLISLTTVGILSINALDEIRFSPALIKYKPYAPSLIVLLIAATGVLQLGLKYGHVWVFLIPTVWIYAATIVSKGKILLPAFLLGLTAGLELWGLVGLFVVFLTATKKKTAVYVVVLTVFIACLIWMPFVLSGEFVMFQYQWEVTADSIWGHSTQFTWWMRVVQIVLLVSGGCIAYLLVKKRIPNVPIIWLAIFLTLVVLVARLLTENKYEPYYLVPVAVLLAITVTGVCLNGNVFAVGVFLPATVLALRPEVLSLPMWVVNGLLFLLIFVGLIFIDFRKVFALSHSSIS